jgi:hypothetical protein
MFSIRDADNKPSKTQHLAHMVALLGPPPPDFLTRSDVASEYFNADGDGSFLQANVEALICYRLLERRH